MLHKAVSAAVRAFETLHIPYAVGGSVASGIRGMPRATMDVDFLAAMSKWQAGPFTKELGEEFYADEDHIRLSIGYGRSFNVIHMPTAFKVDVFPATEDFHFAQLERATSATFDFFGEQITCRVVAPEDVLLAKLRWFRIGGETSERQWNDIGGVISVSHANLDLPYLRNWAAKLRVSDLLEQALNQRED
jgi:hypothetical protein